MRVALLTREYPPEVYGGAGIHVDQLSRYLARYVQVSVYCFGGPRPSPLVAASFEPWDAIADDALRVMSVDLAMAEAVAGVDVVHSHTWYANLAGHLAKLRRGLPHVLTSHSLEPLRPWKAEQLGGGYALSSFCERVAIESADAVIAVSGRMRDDVLSCYPSVAPDRVRAVHNGIDPAEFRPDPGGMDVLDRLGIDSAAPTVVFVGRITRQKGVQYLLAAAPRLPRQAQLVLCAGSPDTPEIGDEVAQLVDAARAAGRRVVWAEQMLERRELVQVLSHASVFVCPSIYEPFGLVNLEAMACELPVVATATGGIPEIVVDGGTGFLVPVQAGGDAYGSPVDADRFVADLADRINRLLADPALARRMGAAGRQRAVEQFSWDAIARRTVEIYREVAAEAARRRGS
jgi:starch synthase